MTKAYKRAKGEFPAIPTIQEERKKQALENLSKNLPDFVDKVDYWEQIIKDPRWTPKEKHGEIDPSRTIHKAPKYMFKLYNRKNRILVRKANQIIYERFAKELKLESTPVYLEWIPSQSAISIKYRKDFVKKVLAVEMDFATYLRKNRRFKYAKQYEDFVRLGAIGKNEHYSKFRPFGSMKIRPAWIKREYKKWINEIGGNVSYQTKTRTTKTGNLREITGTRLIRMSHTGKHAGVNTIWYDIPEENKIDQVYREYFSKPIPNKPLLEALSPDKEDELWGNNNLQNYLRKMNVSPKIYNSIIRDILTLLENELSNTVLQELTEDNVEEYHQTYESRFPNIGKIRSWFISSGLYNTDPDKHSYTLENFKKLRSNQARANFINRAVFLIANSIYVKKNSHLGMRLRTNSGRLIQTAGKKASIKRARKSLKYSKTGINKININGTIVEKKKRRTERVKKYESWRNENKQISTQLRRDITNSEKNAMWKSRGSSYTKRGRR